MNDNNQAAIILAAGFSSRMGAFKPLLELGGKPVLLRLLDSIRAAGLRRVFVVTGYESPRVEEALIRYAETRAESDTIIRTVYNPDFESGMFSSVRAGLRAVSAYVRQAAGDTGSAAPDTTEGAASVVRFDGALLFPVDVPLVAPATIRAVIDAVREAPALPETACPRAQAAAAGDAFLRPAAPPLFAQPVWLDENSRAQNGHPLWIAASVFDEIINYKGAGGLKAVRDLNADRLLRVLTDDEGCVLDMDTPAEFEWLKGFDK